MAASPSYDNGNNQPDNSNRPDEPMSEVTAPPADGDAVDTTNGTARLDDKQQPTEPVKQENTNSTAPEGSSSPGKQDGSNRGEKQIKPNKVYVGGLPEHTRKEDLETCFGKIGRIVNIELKIGYGFVEFDSRAAAEESVAKYHEGFFMGNKIRVELSHGGGRTAKFSNEPGACFKCGQPGHWARECPSSTTDDARRSSAPLIDRIQPPRDYPPPPPRDYPPYEYARYPPPRDPRYSYDYPPATGRDSRRPPSPPPRDYRDYPPVSRSSRDVDDYRLRAPPSRYDARPGYYPEPDVPPPGYPPRYAAPPPRDYYDRYERRPPPPANDRYSPYPASATVRARSPPPPRPRDEYERLPVREYPPPPEYRARPASPSRYADYPPRSAGTQSPRYRRRSQSPVPRSGPGAGYDSYAPSSGGPPYNGNSGGYASNGYSSSAPLRSSAAPRDYPPPRSRDTDVGYRRS